MAKARAACATDGCTNTLQFYEATRNQADRKAAWAEDQGFICSECQEKKRIEENRIAAQQNAELGLPALTGSEKQILWAEKIRADKLALLDTLPTLPVYQIDAWWSWPHLRDFIANDQEKQISAQCTDKADVFKVAIQLPILQKGLALLKQQTKASWWIDNRDSKLSLIIAELLRSLPHEQPSENKALEIEAQAEATVRPEHPETETVAEVNVLDKKVTVSFPEKLETFRLIMRRHGFSWSGRSWVRELNPSHGSAQDRAAEIGHILLGSGFIIHIYDDQVRAMSIAGNYQEEQTRWIKLFTSGADQGRLCITWGRDEDYYKAAKRLPTARYVKPALSVAVEQFEQVLDFAEINGFAISDPAMQAINAAKAAKERALVAHVNLADKVYRGDDGKPVKLDMPDHVDVDDDLRD